MALLSELTGKGFSLFLIKHHSFPTSTDGEKKRSDEHLSRKSSVGS